jgi:hypothetical protein
LFEQSKKMRKQRPAETPPFHDIEQIDRKRLSLGAQALVAGGADASKTYDRFIGILKDPQIGGSRAFINDALPHCGTLLDRQTSQESIRHYTTISLPPDLNVHARDLIRIIQGSGPDSRIIHLLAAALVRNGWAG